MTDSATERRRLWDAMGCEPVFLGMSAGLEVYRRGPLLIGVPPGSDDYFDPARVAVNAARSPWLGDGECAFCHQTLHVHKTAGIRILHRRHCPAKRVPTQLLLEPIEPDKETAHARP